MNNKKVRLQLPNGTILSGIVMEENVTWVKVQGMHGHYPYFEWFNKIFIIVV